MGGFWRTSLSLQGCSKELTPADPGRTRSFLCPEEVNRKLVLVGRTSSSRWSALSEMAWAEPWVLCTVVATCCLWSAMWGSLGGGWGLMYCSVFCPMIVCSGEDFNLGSFLAFITLEKKRGTKFLSFLCDLLPPRVVRIFPCAYINSWQEIKVVSCQVVSHLWYVAIVTPRQSCWSSGSTMLNQQTIQPWSQHISAGLLLPVSSETKDYLSHNLS